MSKKSELKRAINDCENEIKAYEQKIARPQNALIRAMLAGKKPNPEDEQYFNVFSALIDGARERLRALYAELNALDKK